ncbi:MAG: HDOD domain-containing protein [Planctomycetota bacterium]
MIDSAIDPAADPARVELVLRRIDQLPTLSPIAQRVLSLGSADEAELADIVRIIESDPALTGRILSLCRRAEHGLGERITTVERATVMLGFEAVRSAILAVAVFDVMAGDGARIEERDDAGGFQRDGFWKHCIASACAAEAIARAHAELRVPPEEAFVCGLLHDLGKLALDFVLPKSYGRVLRMAEQRRLSAAAAAKRIIGLDHHVAGKRLAEHWSLPTVVRDAMWLHGQPAESLADLPHAATIASVTAGRDAARGLHLGWSGEHDAPPDAADSALRYGLDPDRVQEVALALPAAMSERCGDLGLDAPDSPTLLMEAIARANGWLSETNLQLRQTAASARRQRTLLDAVSRFHRASLVGESVLGATAAAAHSAAGVLGASTTGALLKQGPADPWQFVFVDERGGITGTTRLAAPAEGDGIEAVVRQAAAGDVALGATPLADWLAQTLPDGADPASWRLLPVACDWDRDAPDAVLVHDGQPAGDDLQPLIATWATAIHAAARHDRSRRLSERLADANRALREAQERLAESESMVRLGRMTAGAAHEMNTPLAVISGRAQLLDATLENAEARSAAAAIVDAADRLSGLITTLHVFADPPHPSPAAVPLAPLVRHAVDALRAQLGGAIEVATSLDPSIQDAIVDKELVGRVLLELCRNAAETGSRVSVAARVDPIDDMLVLEVSDAGPGLSEKALKHAFDPFFSEKPAGRQPGLGLTLARRLVDLLGGGLSIENARTGGAVATCTLPGWRPPGGPDTAGEDLVSQHPEAVG